MDLIPSLNGTVQHRPGAVHLHAYPALCYAPLQWGDHIAFASNGVPVDDVLRADVTAETDLVAAIDAIARHCGVSFGCVCDGLKYLRDREAI